MTDTPIDRADELIDYLDAEAEHEIECAQEFTELAKTLRRMETTARWLSSERRALLAAREADAARIAKCRDALQQMLEHSGVADVGPDTKDERDHAAETAALSALRAIEGDQTDE